MSINHYENFPVASVLLPARLRPAVEAIYAFARSADDIADEGDAEPDVRIAQLNAYERALDLIAAGKDVSKANHPSFARLQSVVVRHGLTLQPMRDLLSAFRQDVVQTRYANFDALCDYCRRSANPVGALMLALYQADDARNLRDSDAICTALQLINFWQDVAIDREKQRIYIPQDDLARFEIGPDALLNGEISASDARWRALMRFQVARTRTLMLSGAPLARRLPGRIGWELRLVIQGGLRILERIEAVDYDVFNRRPTLAQRDWLVMLWRALRMRA